ncbi:hypothetical protein ACOBQJ_04785 [Pelotomaculum propionicicum]|uniref:hypothetical protein n=1 Tax=Pelotomaculum propionicicum TaxID=258475 RepID=UPI003B81A774
MKLDYYLPQYHFVERHSITVDSTPEKVYEAFWQLDMAESKVIKNLLKMRGTYGLVSKGKLNKQPSLGLSIKDMINSGFILLEKVENKEVVMGFAGRFWQPSGGIVRNVSMEDFVRFKNNGYCKSAWNFYIGQGNGDELRLSTETRIMCCGRSAKIPFSLYWAAIKPFSGWIRLEMLRMIKKLAE